MADGGQVAVVELRGQAHRVGLVNGEPMVLDTVPPTPGALLREDEQNACRVALGLTAHPEVRAAFESDDEAHPHSGVARETVEEWVNRSGVDALVSVESWERDRLGWVVTVLLEADDGTDRTARIQLHVDDAGYPDAPECDVRRAAEIRGKFDACTTCGAPPERQSEMDGGCCGAVSAGGAR